MRKLLRVLLGSLGILAALVGGLALQSYMKERSRPLYDPATQSLFAYERPGTGAKVLLLHGLASSHTIWMKTIEALPQDLHILAPDLLGFGESPKPQADYGVSTQLRAVDRLLEERDFLSREPILVVGHSLGSIVALAWATEHADLADQIVLLSLPYYRTREQAVEQLSRVSWMHRGMLTRNPFIKVLCYALHGRDIPYLGWLTGLPPAVAEAGLEHNWMSLSRSLRHAVLDTDVGSLVRATPEHLTLVHGSEDPVVPLSNLRALMRELPGPPQLVILEGAGHDLPLERPAQVAQQIVAHLP